MSHHIYQTKAFILDSREIGEANRSISLFTLDLGLINGVAQGIRLLKSKLKASLQDMSFSKIAVVRGREVWRVTSAEKLISLNDQRIPIRIRRILLEIFFFLKRLLPEETKHEDIFNSISKLCAFLMNKENMKIVSKKDCENIKIIAKLRILQSLGYGSDEEFVRQFAEPSKIEIWDFETIQKVNNLEKDLQKHIDEALRQSHL